MKNNTRYSAKVLFDIFKITPFSVIVVVVYYFINGIFPAFVTYFSKEIFQAAEKIIETDQSVQFFGVIVSQFVAVYIIKNILEIVVDTPRSCGIYTKVQYALERNLSYVISKIPYVNFENKRTYDSIFMAREAISKTHFQKVFFSFFEVISMVISLFGIAITLFSSSPLLLVVCLLCVIPQFISRLVRGKEFYRLKVQQVPQEREANYLWNLLTERNVAKEIRSYNSEQFLASKWNNLTDKIYTLQSQFVKREARSFFLWRLLQDLGIIVCVLIAVSLLHNETLGAGDFSACITAIILTQNIFRKILIAAPKMASSIKFVENYYSVMETDMNDKKKEEVSIIKNISFADVCFKYPMGSAFAIENVDFSISQGETIVIVGENGSGKTTLAKLLLGLYEPTKGNVYYNNIDSNKIDKSSLYKNMSVLSQNYTKYFFSIKENITISNTELKENLDNVKSYLQYVNLERFTNDKLDIFLGKEFGGQELSGGEWQRLAIARALYKPANLLVLDEPTSALDPAIESEILSKFVEISEEKRTTIIVSHRIGICTIADRILVMKAGKIIDIGTHTELYDRSLYYRDLFETQRKWYV